MADLRITQLPSLAGALLQSDDALAIVDLSASETKKITAKDLVQAGVSLIDAGSIPGDKVTVVLAPESVGTNELADRSVTSAKLAQNSTAVIGESLPVAGNYAGQLGFISLDNTAYIWDGSAWQPFKTGVLSVVGGTVGAIDTVVTTSGTAVGVLAQVQDSTVAAQFLAGPTTSAGTVELRSIVPADLPIATPSTAGVVSVPIGGGLTMDGGPSGLGADIVIDNTVTSSDVHLLVSYTDKGLVTGGRAINSSDIPISSASSVGGSIAGPEFQIVTGGVLQHSNQVTGSTYCKVSFDNSGHITSGVNLSPDDIPELPASKIGTGVFTTPFIADRAITKNKLANYAISYIQEAVPSVSSTQNHIGMLWFQESTAGLYMWNGNSWMAISIGRLSQENLRYCGTVNATNGLVTGVTEFGISAGYSIGDALGSATNERTGVYFVIDTTGSGIPETPGINYDAGDWVLCNGAAAGWIRINTLSSGGGGGAQTLNDLLDVSVSGAITGDFLQLQASGQWMGVDSIDGGTY